MRLAYDVAAVYAAEASLMKQVPSEQLMAVAAQGVAATVVDALRGVGRIAGTPVVLIVGSGNNGGDALFAGALLARRGLSVKAITVGDTFHDAGAQALLAAGGRLLGIAEGMAAMADAAVVIDGIVGIGARGPLRPEAATVVQAIPAGAAVFAVDLPSGVDPDTGAIATPCVRADVTVTFGTWKPGQFLPPGRDHCGIVEKIDIGLDPHLASLSPAFQVMTLADAAAFYEAPRETSYKYNHGVPGVCAGSPEYPGAPHMVVGAARHAGVGMVRLWQDAAPQVAASVVERFPDVVCTGGPLAQDPKATAWIIGPGLGTGPEQADLVAEALATELPVVIDADALTLVAHHTALRDAIVARSAPTALTPHVAEFARLGFDEGDDRVAAARQAAAELKAIMVLKGAGTVIAGPDGTPFVDTVGPAALATAGTGDALSGLIGAALSQDHDDPVAAVAAAVVVHGLAARVASRDDQPITAWDLVEAVPAAVGEVRRLTPP